MGKRSLPMPLGAPDGTLSPRDTMARRKRPNKPSLRERLADLRLANATQAAVAIAAGLVLVAAWVFGVPRLEAHAAAQNMTRRIEIRFEGASEWVSGEILETLQAAARAELSPDPLKRDDLVRVRSALLAIGWFDAVDQVQRVHAGLVSVSGRFARPAAVLRKHEATLDHLLDERGRLLPWTYPAGASGLTAIVGSWSSLPALPAAPWVAQEAQAGLDLLKLIRQRPWRAQVREIHVTRDPAGSTIDLKLVTDRGSTIVWGREPGREGAGEVPADRKIQYLDYHHEHHGHIDRGLTQELDITGDIVIGR